MPNRLWRLLSGLAREETERAVSRTQREVSERREKLEAAQSEKQREVDEEVRRSLGYATESDWLKSLGIEPREPNKRERG